MKKVIFACMSTMFLTLSVKADIGPDVVLKCGDTFTIVSTIAPTFFKGQLNIDQNAYELNCKQVIEEPANIQKLWNCVENRQGEGKMLVKVETGGAAGSIISAYVEQEQIFPLEPIHIATLNCQ
jgi:hypothetical protein